MSKPKNQPSDMSEGVSLARPNHATHERAALADGGGDARDSARPAGGSRRGDFQGAPPTNRAPLNYIPEETQLLRFGVDSLYLSYPGVMSDEWDQKLARLKTLAQQEEEVTQAVAQVSICDHLFEVRDRGAGRFSYVLVDNAFRIQASNARSKSLPLAYVQISSEYLTHAGIEQAETALRYVVNTLGLVSEPANVSRVDLFADFSASCEMDAFEPLRDWVTRVESLSLHYSYGLFSGWSFGSGGDIVARLYNKTLEIEKKSKKFYLHDLWQQQGWDGNCPVWRMEFEAKRNALVSLNLPKLSDLLPNLAALWRYLTEKWLRLTIPIETDSNRTRWGNHPLWDFITEAFDTEMDAPKLARFYPSRLPEDERLFVHGLGGLTSFMASRGIEDMGEGIGEYFHQAKEYHAVRSGKHNGIEHYVGKKVKGKNRRFNTVQNPDGAPPFDEAASTAYRKASDGE